MNPPELRPVRPDEHPAVFELLADYYSDLEPATIRQRFERILADHPHYQAWGAFLDQRLIGLAGVWIGTKLWCGRYLEVDNFVVHPDHRGQGVGSRLMGRLEELAREADCDMVALDTYTSLHDAHRLYHRLGYAILGYHFVKKLR